MPRGEPPVPLDDRALERVKKAAHRALALSLRSHRARLELTQEKLAEASGLAPIYIRKLESGEKNPSLETLARLAAGLGIGLHELIIPVPGAPAGDDA